MRTQAADARETRRVVITRSREGNMELAGRLDALGFDVVSVETIRFLPPEDWSEIDTSLTKLEEFDWLVFTSTVGARNFISRAKELSVRVPWTGKPAVSAVGVKTKAALQQAGIAVDFVPTEFLTRTLAKDMPRDRGKKLLLLRADVGDPALGANFESAGFQVKEHAIYRTSYTPRKEKVAKGQVDDADAVVFGSPSAVDGFVARLDFAARDSLISKQVLAVCIGPVTAEAARKQGFLRVVVPSSHTFDALLEKLSSRGATGEGS